MIRVLKYKSHMTPQLSETAPVNLFSLIIDFPDIIAMKTEIILFDEPAAALDPLHVKILEQVLSDLSRALRASYIISISGFFKCACRSNGSCKKTSFVSP